MDEAKLEALLKEATVHCFDEEDEFWGVFSALARVISLSLQASVSGEAVTFVGLDGRTSNPEAGVMALVQKDRQKQTAGFSGLEVLKEECRLQWASVGREHH